VISSAPRCLSVLAAILKVIAISNYLKFINI
jgi:hypothetical protein